eukprot:TRINITY_DN5623_c0_g4_i1.p1 TRINITY_DN5623_c0_g4~~TRINITY_DN5623_c0_g4_i1.p1  ORF type:complete len:388 (-),score=74.22 TRINITY_DN5623_c0_g4_i1:430-1518(-)
MEGDCGPGVAVQLAMNPFGKVIESNPRYGMLVIHTTAAELYGRLWCVFEVNEADSSNVEPSGAMSMGYLLNATQKLRQGTPMEDVSSCDTASASCWSKDDEAMIKGKIESGIGYEALNSRIQNFRESSLKRMIDVAQGFSEWCKSTYPAFDEDMVLDMLTQVVRDMGAVYVALHCLYVIAKGHEDDDYIRQLMQEARNCVSKEEDGQHKSIMISDANDDLVEIPPPGFDPQKRSDDPEMMAKIMTDDDFLKEALSDLKKFPQPLGLLEMGAGGNVMAGLSNMIAAQKRNEDAAWDGIKAAFEKFDEDGNGTISCNELSAVLRSLNPEFTENDIQTMFLAADGNQDGVIDFNEFAKWLKSCLV